MKTFLQRLFLGIFALVLISCEGQTLSNRDKGVVAGAALGSGLGAIVGNQSHHPGAGTAIGGGFGAITGGLIGSAMDQQGDHKGDQDEELRRQQDEIYRQRREIEELRRNNNSDDYRYKDDFRYRGNSYDDRRY